MLKFSRCSVFLVGTNTNPSKQVNNLNELSFTIAALLCIPIASYCSIKRLAHENLSLSILDHLINEIGIYPSYFKMRVSGLLSNSWSRRIFVLMVFPLKEEGTTRMICSGVPQGWFRSALCYVIDFDKGITILCNQCLA